MTQFWRVFVSACMLVVATACVSTQTHSTTNEFERIAGDATVLILEPDVQLSFIKASEVREPRADWTETAEGLLIAEIEAQLSAKDASLATFDMDAASPREVQLVKLHEVVGSTIIQHRFAQLPLPTKKDVFDWSLGPGVQELADNNDADYALLIFARGEYASAGKQVANVLMAVAFGATGSTGGQIAFASLIDLKSGDIVWFNLAQTGAGSDMREVEGAEKVVSALLNEIPL